MGNECNSQGLSAWPVPHFTRSWFKGEPVSSTGRNLYQEVLDCCIYRHPHQSKRERTPCLSPVRKGGAILSFAMDFHIPLKTLLVWYLQSSETEIIAQQPCSCPKSRLELAEFFHYLFVSGPCKSQWWFLYLREIISSLSLSPEMQIWEISWVMSQFWPSADEALEVQWFSPK